MLVFSKPAIQESMLDTPDLVVRAKQQLGELEDKSLSLLESAYLPSASSLPSADGRQRGTLSSACKKQTAKN